MEGAGDDDREQLVCNLPPSLETLRLTLMSPVQVLSLALNRYCLRSPSPICIRSLLCSPRPILSTHHTSCVQPPHLAVGCAGQAMKSYMSALAARESRCSIDPVISAGCPAQGEDFDGLIHLRALHLQSNIRDLSSEDEAEGAWYERETAEIHMCDTLSLPLNAFRLILIMSPDVPLLHGVLAGILVVTLLHMAWAQVWPAAVPGESCAHHGRDGACGHSCTRRAHFVPSSRHTSMVAASTTGPAETGGAGVNGSQQKTARDPRHHALAPAQASARSTQQRSVATCGRAPPKCNFSARQPAA